MLRAGRVGMHGRRILPSYETSSHRAFRLRNVEARSAGACPFLPGCDGVAAGSRIGAAFSSAGGIPDPLLSGEQVAPGGFAACAGGRSSARGVGAAVCGGWAGAGAAGRCRRERAVGRGRGVVLRRCGGGLAEPGRVGGVCAGAGRSLPAGRHAGGDPRRRGAALRTAFCVGLCHLAGPARRRAGVSIDRQGR